MSALPLIEAVQRAGGAITLQGDQLRLSAPEPLPENLLQELRLHKAEVLDHLRHAPGSGLQESAALRSEVVEGRRVAGSLPMSERASPKAASVAASLSEQLRDATTGALGTHCRRWR